MGDGKGTFFVLDMIILFVFVGLILMIFNLRRIAFVSELFILIVLLLLAFIALIGIYNRNNWGFVLLSIVFAAILIDLLLIYYLKRSFSFEFVLTALLSALGFMIAIAGIKRKEEKVSEEDKEEVTKTFEPGKFVASKTGSTYHAPTCDWAKKIKKKNQVWFDDENEARNSYKPHSCLK